ncbi:hypothetical protein BFJ72_g9582 [Fusarium proliferatum]|uniref:Uncharacterized protein n=1 Tax=Gibberella intermedia TaxID=948311 RepID=A0A420SXT2_GIBIN|nr:hypothetical protein BFJ72_g9582 [Fusarium proliferatum]
MAWIVENFQVPVPLGDCSIHILIKDRESVEYAFIMDGGVDSGEYSASKAIILALDYVKRYLGSQYGIEEKKIKFNLWVVTHWDADHFRGMMDLIANFGEKNKKEGVKKNSKVIEEVEIPGPTGWMAEIFVEDPFLYCGRLEEPFTSQAVSEIPSGSEVQYRIRLIGYLVEQSLLGFSLTAGESARGLDMLSGVKIFNADGTPEPSELDDSRPRFCIVGADGYGISVPRFQQDVNRNQSSILAVLFWPGNDGQCCFYAGGDGFPELESKIISEFLKKSSIVKLGDGLDLMKLDHHGSSQENIYGGDLREVKLARGMKLADMPIGVFKARNFLVTPGNRHGHPTYDVVMCLVDLLRLATGITEDGRPRGRVWTTRSPYWATKKTPTTKDLSVYHNKDLLEILEKYRQAYRDDTKEDLDIGMLLATEAEVSQKHLDRAKALKAWKTKILQQAAILVGFPSLPCGSMKWPCRRSWLCQTTKITACTGWQKPDQPPGGEESGSRMGGDGKCYCLRDAEVLTLSFFELDNVKWNMPSSDEEEEPKTDNSIQEEKETQTQKEEAEEATASTQLDYVDITQDDVMNIRFGGHEMWNSICNQGVVPAPIDPFFIVHFSWVDAVFQPVEYLGRDGNPKDYKPEPSVPPRHSKRPPRNKTAQKQKIVVPRLTKSKTLKMEEESLVIRLTKQDDLFYVDERSSFFHDSNNQGKGPDSDIDLSMPDLYVPIGRYGSQALKDHRLLTNISEIGGHSAIDNLKGTSSKGFYPLQLGSTTLKTDFCTVASLPTGIDTMLSSPGITTRDISSTFKTNAQFERSAAILESTFMKGLKATGSELELENEDEKDAESSMEEEADEGFVPDAAWEDEDIDIDKVLKTLQTLEKDYQEAWNKSLPPAGNGKRQKRTLERMKNGVSKMKEINEKAEKEVADIDPALFFGDVGEISQEMIEKLLVMAVTYIPPKPEKKKRGDKGFKGNPGDKERLKARRNKKTPDNKMEMEEEEDGKSNLVKRGRKTVQNRASKKPESERGPGIGGPEQRSQEMDAPNAKTDGCENCAKFGCPCPGYTQKLRWSHKHQQHETSISEETNLGRNVQLQDPLPVIQAEDFNIQVGSTDLQDVLDTLPDEPIILNDDGDSSWLSETAPNWQATDLIIGVGHVGESLQDPFNSLERPEESSSRHDPILNSNPSIIQAPLYISTTLIEYWFRYICPVRSTFDSEVKNNRSLARDSWATSEAVFYTMQVMSAVCLVDTMPHLRQTLPSLREQSTLAITQGISRVRNLGLGPVTADLVFAVLARGTSSHWITPGNLDYSWLESARKLLSIWTVGISAADALLHAYFCQALAYWEMLRALVGRGSNPSIVEKRRRKYQDKLRQAMLPEDGTIGTRSHPHLSINSNFKPLGTLPNSWCGISNEVIETFGQILALCRSACDYNQDQRTVGLDIASKILCDIAVARELEKELLSMDFDTIVLLEELQGFYVDTRDYNTPVSHLLETAEAYRKAGLLQLYLIFDDLPVNASGGQDSLAHGCDDAKDKICREKCLIDLALQLVATLERIPAESGSKFIHPMLYVSAAAGLKFQKYPHFPCAGTPEEVNNDPSDIFTSQLECNLLDLISTACLPGSSDTMTAFIPQSVLKVAEARHLVLSRLDTIRQALPYKASDSFLRLVKTIWSEYDEAQSETSAKHWFKISSQIGLDMPL